MQPSLPLFSAPDAPGPPGRPDRHVRVDGVDGFLVGDVVKVDGLRGGFRCRAFFLDGEVPTAEVFGPLLDGRSAARVPAVRTFPLVRLRRAGRRSQRPGPAHGPPLENRGGPTS